MPVAAARAFLAVSYRMRSVVPSHLAAVAAPPVPGGPTSLLRGTLKHSGVTWGSHWSHDVGPIDPAQAG
jgi:hypothetical protein